MGKNVLSRAAFGMIKFHVTPGRTRRFSRGSRSRRSRSARHGIGQAFSNPGSPVRQPFCSACSRASRSTSASVGCSVVTDSKIMARSSRMPTCQVRREPRHRTLYGARRDIEIEQKGSSRLSRAVSSAEMSGSGAGESIAANVPALDRMSRAWAGRAGVNVSGDGGQGPAR